MLPSERPQLVSDTVRSNVLSAAAGAEIAAWRIGQVKEDPAMPMSDVLLALREAVGELERATSFVMRAREEVERASA
jgi:hypothetical protein